jgi:hypothetical protein
MEDIKSSVINNKSIKTLINDIHQEINDFWHYKTKDGELKDLQFHYGEDGFIATMVSALRKQTPAILTELNIGSRRFIDYWCLIEKEEFFIEVKLLDVKGKSLYDQSNKYALDEIHKCFIQLSDVNKNIFENKNLIQCGQKVYKLGLIFLRIKGFDDQKIKELLNSPVKVKKFKKSFNQFRNNPKNKFQKKVLNAVMRT